MNVEVPGGTICNGPRLAPFSDTSTSLYFPLDVDAMDSHDAGPEQAMPLTEVVPGTVKTVDDPG